MGQSISSNGRTLLSAVKKGNEEQVQHIIEANPEVVLFSSLFLSKTPLCTAAKYGPLSVVRIFTDTALSILDRTTFHAHINEPDIRGNTPLYAAAKSGKNDIVKHLLSLGADPLPVNRCGNTSLHAAADHGHAECVADLLDARVDAFIGEFNAVAAGAPVRDAMGRITKYIDALSGEGLAPLHLAVLSRSAATVRALISRGAQLDVRIGRGVERGPYLCAGSTPLHIAAAIGDVAVTIELLSRGGQLSSGLEERHLWHLRNAYGLSPLNCALLGGRPEIVTLIIASAQNHRGGRHSYATMLYSDAPLPYGLHERMKAALKRAVLLLQLKQISQLWGYDGGILGQVRGLDQIDDKLVLALFQIFCSEQETSQSVTLRDVQRAIRQEDGDEDASNGRRRALIEMETILTLGRSVSESESWHRKERQRLSRGERLEEEAAEEECCVCLDGKTEVELCPCAHSLCFECVCRLCVTSTREPACPLCRQCFTHVAALS